MSASGPFHVLLVGESALSHGSTLKRMGRALGAAPGTRVTLRLVTEEETGPVARIVRRTRAIGPVDPLPLVWRLRQSAHVRRLLGLRSGADVALINTQACALLSVSAMRRRPTVLSVDATHAQLAGLGYRKRAARASLSEAPVEFLERRAYAHARHVLAWTEWTAGSLRDDYGIGPERLSVVHPGIDLPPAPAPRSTHAEGPLRVLFVGNDVGRKGLEDLLAASEATRAPVLVDVLSTDDELPALDDPRMRLHPDVRPGDARHRELFATADVFALPTRADAVPWAIVEALAAGLPVLSTRVGAIPELVGDAGLLVERGDRRGLAEVLDALASDPARRRELGALARARAERHYDAAAQTPRIREVLQNSTDHTYGRRRS